MADGATTVTGPGHRPVRTPAEAVRRWWPALLALAIGIGAQVLDGPWSDEPWTLWFLPALPLLYLAFGAFRGRLRDRRVLAVQLAGLLVWTALLVVALVADPGLGRWVVAAGWFGHGVWDVAHHRDLNHNRCTGVVPRWYAEMCVVVDMMAGCALLAPLVTA
jgi:hypothetical protein